MRRASSARRSRHLASRVSSHGAEKPIYPGCGSNCDVASCRSRSRRCSPSLLSRSHTILPDGGSVAHFFDYRLYYAIIVVAAGLTIARAVFSPLHRGAWIALAAAVSSYATAEFIWLFLYSSSRQPTLSLDRGRLLPGFYPASYIGLLLLLRARLRSLTPGVWVDGLTAALAVAAIGSAVLIGVVLESTDGPVVRGGDEHGLSARRRDPPLARRRRASHSPDGIPAAPGRSSERRSRSALSPTARTSTRRQRERTARVASSTPPGRPACS